MLLTIKDISRSLKWYFSSVHEGNFDSFIVSLCLPFQLHLLKWETATFSAYLLITTTANSNRKHFADFNVWLLHFVTFVLHFPCCWPQCYELLRYFFLLSATISQTCSVEVRARARAAKKKTYAKHQTSLCVWFRWGRRNFKLNSGLLLLL